MPLAASSIAAVLPVFRVLNVLGVLALRRVRFFHPCRELFS
jgi:hypothetical protein